MKKILLGSFSIAFIIYWFIIFSYNLPNKYLADKLPSIFGVFNHTWSLFAPMPTNNIRLYYDYQYSDKTISIEVLEEINIKKSNAAPFLTKYRLKDFGLTGPIYMIDYRRSNYPIPEKQCPDEMYQELLNENELAFFETYKNEPEFQHLYNYGRVFIEDNDQFKTPEKLRYRIVFEPITTPEGKTFENKTIFTSPFQSY